MPGSADILGAIGRLVGGLDDMPGALHLRIWEELRPWMGRLALHAAPKWLPRIALGVRCQVPVYEHGQPVGSCRHVASVQCCGCGRTSCLDHSFIDGLGEGVCYLCAAELARARRASAAANGSDPWKRQAPPPAPKPTDETPAWARKVLGVKDGTPWDDVRSAHRKLSAKHHPDVHKGDKAKEKATEKFKQVQRAFDVLTKEREMAQQAAE